MDGQAWAAIIAAMIALIGSAWAVFLTSRSNADLAARQTEAAAALAVKQEAASAALATRQQEADARLTQLSASLQRDARQEDRRTEEEAALDRYREPLLAAADDLRGRLNNLRNKNFHSYMKPLARAESPKPGDHLLSRWEWSDRLAVLSTMYRFAVYFGWVEHLARQVTYLHFDTDMDTREVADLLAEVGRTFARDDLDVIDGTPRMMLWREEQRAIGELMRREDGRPGLLGFDEFVSRYEQRHGQWMQALTQDLLVDKVVKGERLRRLEQKLTALIQRLDADGLYTGKRKRSTAPTRK